MKRLHMLPDIIFATLLGAVFLLFACQTPAPQPGESQEATAVELDTLMGDWQGEFTAAGGETRPLAAQVIAYDNGVYHARFLSTLSERVEPLAEVEGKRAGETVNFSGSGWEGVIGSDFLFSGTGDGGSFTMNKTERRSPTLGAAPPDGAIVLFDGSNLAKWQHVPAPAGFIDLAKHIGGDQRAAYLRSEIWSPAAQPAVLELGSDDGIKAWLNGEVVAANNTARGAAPAQEKANVTLNAGWNTLLLKITQGTGGWGAFARLADEKGSALTNIAEKIPGSDLPEGSREHLERSKGFLTVWQIAGPYYEEGKSGEAIFDRAFAPEISGETPEWQSFSIGEADLTPQWRLTGGAMEVQPGSGSLMTRDQFGSFDLHLEFRSPFMPAAKGQARGNSGVYLHGRYEIQVLDSYGLEGKENECGGIYKAARPLLNMCAPPGQWQTYDIAFTAPQFDATGNKTANARLTVQHNGVTIHQDLELPEATPGGVDQTEAPTGPLLLQDHSDLVQYRNIWLVAR